MNDFVQSKYCYPGTDVLINYAGIRDEEQLKVFESIVTANRLAQLILTPTLGNFDLTHLKSIHHHIFQDVYPFAGKLRTEDIVKDTFRFAPMQFLESSATDLFRDLAKEKFLKDLPMADFAKRASHYMAEINVLHPFREGNGRPCTEGIYPSARCECRLSAGLVEGGQVFGYASFHSLQGRYAGPLRCHRALSGQDALIII
ncbi:Fic/DOC family protein [Paenibacillus tyrfis]|uniref:Fic/DOC family protein n=1 Tax=Paenibacillus tyrfis TaxID=1501230 RepID=UPI0015C6551A|nr:Fic family protein [Paenibacillus tyrfis]